MVAAWSLKTGNADGFSDPLASRSSAGWAFHRRVRRAAYASLASWSTPTKDNG
jgi:hypothetical protein